MSKPKRRSVADQLGHEEDLTLSRDDVVTSDDPPLEKADVPAAPARKLTRAPRASKVVETASPGPRRRSANDRQRHSFHTSLYLPNEAQFALREIALTMRRAKPHDVMLEAMAELFEKYNKGDLARECRRRIASRDKVIT